MSWQDIPGWFDFQDIYNEAVRDAPKGAILVEVGVAFGKSLAYLARQAIDQKRDDLVIIGVDPWIVEDWLERDCKRYYEPYGGFFEAFDHYMYVHAVEEYNRVQIYRRTSVEAATSWISDDSARPHFVFIDGDHNYAGIKADIPAWREVVAPGGVLAGHDYGGFEGVRKAVHEEFGDDFVVRGSSWWRRM